MPLIMRMLEVAVMLNFRHDITPDGYSTKCGIGADEPLPPNRCLEIGCNCGHPDCVYPITCPVCKGVRH